MPFSTTIEIGAMRTTRYHKRFPYAVGIGADDVHARFRLRRREIWRRGEVAYLLHNAYKPFEHLGSVTALITERKIWHRPLCGEDCHGRSGHCLEMEMIGSRRAAACAVIEERHPFESLREPEHVVESTATIPHNHLRRMRLARNGEMIWEDRIRINKYLVIKIGKPVTECRRLQCALLPGTRRTTKETGACGYRRGIYFCSCRAHARGIVLNHKRHAIFMSCGDKHTCAYTEKRLYISGSQRPLHKLPPVKIL